MEKKMDECLILVDKAMVTMMMEASHGEEDG